MSLSHCGRSLWTSPASWMHSGPRLWSCPGGPLRPNERVGKVQKESPLLWLFSRALRGQGERTDDLMGLLRFIH